MLSDMLRDSKLSNGMCFVIKVSLAVPQLWNNIIFVEEKILYMGNIPLLDVRKGPLRGTEAVEVTTAPPLSPPLIDAQDGRVEA